MAARPQVMTLVAPNTIAQGDTRQTGLKRLLADGWEIYSADRDLPWPGDANVTISIVSLVRWRDCRCGRCAWCADE